AILYFIDEKVELAIFEIGIGGLNDSTNSINSIINIITNISLEHTDILGKTIKKIAEQKAGIIKNKSIVITNTSKGLNIIKDKCNQTNSDLYILKKSVKIKKISSNFPHYTYRIKIDNKYYTLKFQSYYLVENFSIALLASLIYSKNIIKNINLENKDLQEIINSLNVPLKMQIFKHKNKEIIIDTAKDYSSLMKLFKELLKNQKDFDVILSFSKGKEIKLIKKIFLLLINNNIRIYLTEHSIEEKKMRINKLMENLNKIMSENEKNKLIKHVEIIPQIKDTESLYDILEKTNKNHIVITGSLYFVSEIYNLLKETPIKNK
ncbi:MAG: hypothetical protein N2169_07015, partial [bacterium]|nr:hypothetical protein [bacterium]